MQSIERFISRVIQDVAQMPVQLTGEAWSVLIACVLVIGLLCLRGSSLRGR